MKTNNSVQKTGNRNNQSSVMKTLVVLTGVAMFSFISNTEASNSQNHMAAALYSPNYAVAAEVANPAETGSAGSLEAFLQAEVEESMKMEGWIVDGEMFTAPAIAVETESTGSLEEFLQAEVEESMKMEGWTVDGEVFTAPAIAVETE